MKFGQYELLERIAIGGMAEVYRGRVAGAEGFEKLVAIKRILPEFARDERFISMLLTEARIHSALSHRNIVQIHDLGISEDGEYFIVLEYVEGHDLRAVMEAATALNVQIPDSLALHIAEELAQALQFAHELKDADGHPLGIIHRDVSPSNVLLSNSGEVKLSDFGIAKRQHEHSVVGSLKGNLVYMSPEQAGRGPLDRRTDIFSLGAVLFEMLTGQRPREITDEVNGWREVAAGTVRSARTVRPDIPDAYDALLKRALAADPADRFPDAAAFGTAIRELRRESDAPVGPSDIKELVELLDPPRHARSPVERSRVIRLGPESKLPHGAARSLRPGGAGDAPVIAAPGLIPAVGGWPSRPENGAALRADSANRGLAAATPAPKAVTSKTPPLFTPPPPGVTPLPHGLPSFGPRSAGTGSSNGTHLNPSQVTPPAPAASSALPSPLVTPAPAFPDVAIDVEAMTTPPPQAHAGLAAFPASGPNWSGASQRGTLTPIASTLRGTGPQTTSGGFPSGFAPATAVIAHARPRRRGLTVGLVLVGVLGAGAAVVNYQVMPLNVLAVWTQPAWLSVRSDPAGADVKLDGRTQADRTPARLQVRRDRADHVLELSRTGSLPVREKIRFDKSVALSASLKLPDAPPPPPPVEAPKAPVAAAEPEKVAAKAPTDSTGDDAGDKAGKKHKKAKKEKKAKKSKKGKAGKNGKKGKKRKKSKSGE